MIDCRADPFTQARARRCSGRASNEHHDALDIVLVAGVDDALRNALVERAQGATPVALDEEPGVSHQLHLLEALRDKSFG